MRTPTERRLPIVLVAALLAGSLSFPPTLLRAASLRITTADVARPVWIDESYAGLAPLVIDGLAAGTHLIAVGDRAESTDWVRPYRTKVTLVMEETRQIEVPPLQLVRIVSSGRPVAVALDAEPVGWTPLHLLVPADRSLELRAGTQAPQLYRAASGADSTLVVAGPPELRRAPAQLTSSRGGLLLPLGAVVFGVAGALARQEGDRAYDDYRSTVDRSRMEDLYDRAGRYDDLAVGCWVTAEALLVASVWRWLRGPGTNDARTPQVPLSLEAERGEVRFGVRLPLGSGSETP